MLLQKCGSVNVFLYNLMEEAVEFVIQYHIKLATSSSSVNTLLSSLHWWNLEMI